MHRFVLAIRVAAPDVIVSEWEKQLLATDMEERSTWIIWIAYPKFGLQLQNDIFFHEHIPRTAPTKNTPWPPYTQSNVIKAQIPKAMPVINTPDTAP